MAYRELTFKFVIDFIEFNLKGLKMLELGNQLICDDYNGFFVAKDYFKSLGIIHTSIDLNGKHGALKIDLGKPIIENLGKFDVITNMGTSEHIINNDECFNNIDNFCKVGGRMFHLVPYVGSTHGEVQYTLDWFKELAEEKNYKIIYLERNGKYEFKKDQDRIYAVLEKK